MNSPEAYKSIKISYKDSAVINFLYNTLPGRVLMCALSKTPVSRLGGVFMDSRLSCVLIRDFIKSNGIDMREYKAVKYKSFNDFFKREIKEERRPFSDNPNDVCSPCDGKLTAYPITRNGVFKIKNSVYTVKSLLRDKKLAEEFIGGECLIYRLTTDDYHRYSYIDNAKSLFRRRIEGALHSVRPICLQKYKVFAQNAREYELLETENFGRVIQMEVGALFIGRISNRAAQLSVERGEEKGCFEFGGSTIIMLFKKGAIKIDEAIRENTRQDRETVVKMGQRVGEK